MSVRARRNLRGVPAKRTRAARYAKRRKTRLSKVDNDLTDAQWVAVKRAWGGCAYCEKPGDSLQRDCILAVSRGGRYTLANVVPACRSCNASKCNEEVTTWMRRKRFDERRFLLELHRTQTELAAQFPGSD